MTPFAPFAEAAQTTITLRGNVSNLLAKRSAERTLGQVVGITHIVNRLKVKQADAVEDSVVAVEIQQAVGRDAYLAGGNIHVAVEASIVKLTGTVENCFQKARADDLAAMGKNVIDVHNQLEVTGSGVCTYNPYIDTFNVRSFPWFSERPRQGLGRDSDIRDNIVKELRWSPFVSADAVKVSVHSGVATLTGTVGCRWQQLSALQCALAAGAAALDDQLTVETETAVAQKAEME